MDWLKDKNNKCSEKDKKKKENNAIKDVVT